MCFSHEIYMHLTTFACTWILFQVPKMMVLGPQIDKNEPRNMIQNEHIFRLTFCPLFGPIWDPLGRRLGPQMGRKNVHEPTLGSLGRILALTWRAPSGTMTS